MAIPTRLIEQEEFEELIAVEEGDTIPIYKLAALSFDPPVPLEEGDEVASPLPEQAIRVMLLAVVEPRLYRDRQKVLFVVYPSFDTLDYDAAQDLHPIKGAWCYRFAPYHWDKGSTLAHAEYLFREDPVPAFELGDTDTH